MKTVIDNNTNFEWRKVSDRAYKNMEVLYVNDKRVGFITKPRDTHKEKHAWEVFVFHNGEAKSIWHTWKKSVAVLILEQGYVGPGCKTIHQQ